MANYENSRIRCSKATAKCLMTDKSDAYYDPIDFRKALDYEPGAYISYDIRYGQMYANRVQLSGWMFLSVF